MSPEEWYKTLPPLTKIYWSAAVLTTILTSIGVINPMQLYLDMDMVFGKFNVCGEHTQARRWEANRAGRSDQIRTLRKRMMRSSEFEPDLTRLPPCSVSVRVQIWRLLTNFLFFGKFGMSFIFQVVLLSVREGSTPRRRCSASSSS